MFPPYRILFPIDFSDRCMDAARMVEIFAGHFQSKLTLLHVLEPLTYNDLPSATITRVDKQLRTFLADELKHFDVERVLLHGDAGQQIADFAQSRKFDLIMLPSHGYGRFRRFILGSVTAKVLHDAHCPVWTGVHMENVPRLEDIALRRIVCAIDLGKQSCHTLRWAHQMAADFDAQLQLIHTIPALQYLDSKAQEQVIHQVTERVRAIQECVGSTAPLEIVSGEVAEAVSGFGRRVNADLVVIGRSVEEGLVGRLRTNAYAIIRESPCPVVSV